ncbi:MAG: DUF995 domain-containing protein [Marivibrio sp.]|uniref:DUF995 domain-containing protein n=1 Tax=Marivibrio sp. TaxID=2039719 RepID=UPI0032EE9371
MGILKKALIGAAALAALAACGTTEEAMQEEGATQLAKWEIEATLNDSTREWASGNGHSYYAPDGAYLWKMNNGTTGDGTWRVNDADQMCFTVDEWFNGVEQCYTMYKKPDGQIVSIGPKGKEHKLGAYQEGNTL